MKKSLALFVALMMALSLAACGGSSSSAAASSAPAASAASTASSKATTGGGKVGIAMPTKSLERWNRDGSFLQKQFESKGCEVELVYSDNDVNQQVNDIENLIADKVNLLVIAAIDGESLSNVLDSADQAGIPVISYDRLIMLPKDYINYKLTGVHCTDYSDASGMFSEATSRLLMVCSRRFCRAPRSARVAETTLIAPPPAAFFSKLRAAAAESWSATDRLAMPRPVVLMNSNT